MTQSRSMEDSMSSSAILQGKHAVVFGAGGSVGAAVAQEFAAEGSEVFLAGRTKWAWKRWQGKSRRAVAVRTRQ